MRLLALLGLVFLLACSPPAAAPSKRSLVRELVGETVALVRIGVRVEFADTGSKMEPYTQAFCSGVWVSGSSILTAHHCVDNLEMGQEAAYLIEREFDESKLLQRVHAAKLVAVDPDHDLAILRAPNAPLHDVAALSLETISAGDDAHTMGHPRGLWFSYSSGEVAAVRKALFPAVEDDPIKETLWVQTDAPISGGNSGGGLFDAHGNLIGICSRTRRDGNELHFYVHRDHLKVFLAKQAVL